VKVCFCDETDLEEGDHGTEERSEVLWVIGFEQENASDGKVKEEQEDEQDDIEQSHSGGRDGLHDDAQLRDPTQQPQQAKDP
jgi:hypothetical protein